MSLGITGKLILGFVTLLLGAVLITSVADNNVAVTDKRWIANEVVTTTPINITDPNTTEVHTLANAPTAWKKTGCPLTNVAIGNSTEDFTETTDYTVDLNEGTFLIVKSSTTVGSIQGGDNSTYVDYNYCGDDYMNLSWGRSIINLVGGFFAIAILLVSVGLFFSVGKDTGII